MLQVPEEWRKQAKHFAATLRLNIHERQAGVPFKEAIFKTLISASFRGVRVASITIRDGTSMSGFMRIHEESERSSMSKGSSVFPV